MEKFTKLTAKAMPLPVRDVDTDQIIPAQFMTSVSREGYGANLFRNVREKDPNFPYNQERYRDAQILIADYNFGCGSSREHAVWALTDAGFKAVISSGFADIFFSNSAKNGLVLVVLPQSVVDNFLDQAKSGEFRITVDLEQQCVVTPEGESIPFEFDAFRKHCIINGLDDLDYITSQQEAVSKFRAAQQQQRFHSTLSCKE